MKKTIIWAAFALLAAAGAAQAADLNRGYYKAPAAYAPPPVYSWMGPYIGLNLGYQWGDVTHNPAEPSGFAGGLQIGHNWQMGQFVYGLETDIQLSGADDKFAGWKFSNPWFGTARGRVGYAFNNVLLYGTGGLAFGSIKAETFGLSESHTSAGWTAGVGAEIALTRNWSAKVEYLYVDLSDKTFTLTGAPNGYEFSTVRVGVNYRF